jgi:hypothetical protein
LERKRTGTYSGWRRGHTHPLARFHFGTFSPPQTVHIKGIKRQLGIRLSKSDRKLQHREREKWLAASRKKHPYYIPHKLPDVLPSASVSSAHASTPKFAERT